MLQQPPTQPEYEAQFELAQKHDVDGDFFYDTKTYLANVNEREFIIDNILPAGSVTMLHGREGTGKTRFALACAKAVATGTNFLGFHTEQGEVLYLNIDRMHKQDIKERLKELSKSDEEVAEWASNITWSEREMNFLSEDLKQDKNGHACTEIQYLINYCKARDFKLVVIDTYHRLLTSHDLDERNEGDANKICSAVRDIARETEAAVLMLHHTPVGDDTRGRGSGASGATVDHVLSLRGKINKKLTIVHGKTRLSCIHVYPIQITEKFNVNEETTLNTGEPRGAWIGLINQTRLTPDDKDIQTKYDFNHLWYCAKNLYPPAGEPYGDNKRILKWTNALNAIGGDKDRLKAVRAYAREIGLLKTTKGQNQDWIITIK